MKNDIIRGLLWAGSGRSASAAGWPAAGGCGPSEPASTSWKPSVVGASGQRNEIPADTNSSACIPKGYLQGHYLTPGAHQLLQQHLAPPTLPHGATEGLYEVVPNEQGGLEYDLATDVRKLIIIQEADKNRKLEKRTRVEEITDPCHPCLRNALPGVEVPEGCGRRPLRSVFMESVRANTMVGAYVGQVRTSGEDNALAHMEGHTNTRLFMESYTIDLALPAQDSSDPLSLVVVGDPELHRMATLNDARAWGEPCGAAACNCDRYLTATPNCTTRTFLWVKREGGPRGGLLYVPLLAVMTSRKVEAGEEATWAYGDGYWSGIEQNVKEFQKGQELEAALLGMAGGRLDASQQLLQLGHQGEALAHLQKHHAACSAWLTRLQFSHGQQAARWAALHPLHAAAPGPLERRIRAMQAAIERRWVELLKEAERLSAAAGQALSAAAGGKAAAAAGLAVQAAAAPAEVPAAQAAAAGAAGESVAVGGQVEGKQQSPEVPAADAGGRQDAASPLEGAASVATHLEYTTPTESGGSDTEPAAAALAAAGGEGVGGDLPSSSSCTHPVLPAAAGQQQGQEECTGQQQGQQQVCRQDQEVASAAAGLGSGAEDESLDKGAGADKAGEAIGVLGDNKQQQQQQQQQEEEEEAVTDECEQQQQQQPQLQAEEMDVDVDEAWDTANEEEEEEEEEEELEEVDPEELVKYQQPQQQQQQQQQHGDLPSLDEKQQQQQQHGDLPLLAEKQQQQPHGDLPSLAEKQQQQPHGDLPLLAEKQQQQQPHGDLPSLDEKQQQQPHSDLPSLDEKQQQQQQQQPHGDLPSLAPQQQLQQQQWRKRCEDQPAASQQQLPLAAAITAEQRGQQAELQLVQQEVPDVLGMQEEGQEGQGDQPQQQQVQHPQQQHDQLPSVQQHHKQQQQRKRPSDDLPATSNKQQRQQPQPPQQQQHKIPGDRAFLQKFKEAWSRGRLLLPPTSAPAPYEYEKPTVGAWLRLRQAEQARLQLTSRCAPLPKLGGQGGGAAAGGGRVGKSSKGADVLKGRAVLRGFPLVPGRSLGNSGWPVGQEGKPPGQPRTSFGRQGKPPGQPRISPEQGSKLLGRPGLLLGYVQGGPTTTAAGGEDRRRAIAAVDGAAASGAAAAAAAAAEATGAAAAGGAAAAAGRVTALA